MEKDNTATETSDVPQKKKFFAKENFTKEKIIAHFKKWWWVHFLILAAVVLLIALPLVYVGYPNIAQGFVNSAEIHLVNATFSNPTQNTIQVVLNANLTVHTIFHASLDAWNATLHNQGSDVPLFTIPIPAFKSITGTPIHVDTTATIENMDAFNTFAANGFSSSSLSIDLTGNGGLKLGALPHITVSYNKTVTLPGLDGLKSLETTDLVYNTAAPDYNNTQGQVIINNQSPLNLQLGDTSFNVYLQNNGTLIGNATIPNFNLQQGNLSYPLDLATSVVQIAGILASPQYGCGVLPVTVVGQNVTVNGEEIPYWTYAFTHSNITTSVNVTSTLAGLGLTLQNINPSGTCS